MLFSATLDNGIDALVRRFLRDEVRHEVDEASVPQGVMTHRVFVVPDPEQKTALVRHLASGHGRRILFTRTKHQAKKLAKQLTAAGIPAVDLHGNLSQGARERNLAAFGADAAAGGVRVLVATDVAARGVHVDEVELVVHVDPPVEHKAYLHRSGRTARAGAEGVVVTVALDAQRKDVTDLLRKAKITARLEPVQPSGAEVSELVGEPAPHVQPAPVQQAAASRSGRSKTAQGSAPRQEQKPQQRGGRQNAAGRKQSAQPRTDGRGQGAGQRGAASSQPAPQAGRDASGRPTTGARVGGMPRGPRRASRPAGR